MASEDEGEVLGYELERAVAKPAPKVCGSRPLLTLY